MKIIIVDKNKESKVMGDTENLPVPRINEQVKWHHYPYPIVKSIMYDYEDNAVIVVIA